LKGTALAVPLKHTKGLWPLRVKIESSGDLKRKARAQDDNFINQWQTFSIYGGAYAV